MDRQAITRVAALVLTLIVQLVCHAENVERASGFGLVFAIDAPPISESVAANQLGDFDSAFSTLSGAVSRWSNSPGLPRDSRGVDAATDMRQFVLPAELRERVAQARERAAAELAAGHDAGARLQLAPAIAEINAAADRFRAIRQYWATREPHEALARRWRRLADSNALVSVNRAPVTQRQNLLDEHLREGRFAEGMKDDWPLLDALYVQAITDAYASSPNQPLKDDPRTFGPTICDGEYQPDPPTQPGDKFVAAESDFRKSKSSDKFYPPGERAKHIAGFIILRGQLSPRGCLRWVEITRPNGSEPLNQAALAWAIKGAMFNPAWLNGKRIEHSVDFAVYFGVLPRGDDIRLGDHRD